MRTTIDLPDHIMKKAKIKAIEEGITLKEFFIKALEKEMQPATISSSTPPWKQLIGKGSATELTPECSGFSDYSGPDWHTDIHLNEPGA